MLRRIKCLPSIWSIGRTAFLPVVFAAIVCLFLIGSAGFYFGNTVSAAITNVLAVGTLDDSEVIGGPATVTFRTISFAPGEVGQWHYHPGPLFNVVTQGTVTLETPCHGERSYGPGEAFEEGGTVHRPKNLGDEATFAYQAFVVPQGQPTTINLPNYRPRCRIALGE